MSKAIGPTARTSRRSAQKSAPSRRRIKEATTSAGRKKANKYNPGDLGPYRGPNADSGVEVRPKSMVLSHHSERRESQTRGTSGEEKVGTPHTKPPPTILYSK
ncbi:hypothetical protein HNY73_016790 [Argiope bruennichi]|uniref:Uncharacterized protein n=1 Tax=Argiope bruennichi TaxID=94029 RepID=A0A8T0ELC5_ARGBR|nr:hypothetical protein HNY73_016790 [Argiope bruennichi]